MMDSESLLIQSSVTLGSVSSNYIFDISGVLQKVVVPLAPNTFVNVGAFGKTAVLKDFAALMTARIATCSTCAAGDALKAACAPNADTNCGSE